MKRFYIESFTDVFIDSYEEGEEEHVNQYSNSRVIEAEDYKKAIEKYFDKELARSINVENIEADEAEEDYPAFWWSNLVDVDNNEVTENDIMYHDWKSGKMVLYGARTRVSVSELVPVKIK